MSINHKDIVNDERHLPKDFEGASNETVLGKDENGNLEWLGRDQVGGPPGPPGTTDHDQLINLTNDTHPQYLRTDGGRALTGNLNAGGNSFNNVDEINSIPAALATTNNSGFMSSADKDKLDNIPANTQAQITSNQNQITSNQNDFLDHSDRHLPSSGSDPLPVDTPVDIGTSNDEGSADSFARSDHRHAHGDQPGGSLHADATPIESGFMSSADKGKLDGIASNTQSQINQNASDISTNQGNISQNSTDISTNSSNIAQNTSDIQSNETLLNSHAARHLPSSGADPLPVGTPSSLGTSNQEGSADSFARQDHVHDHADQPGGTLHAEATPSVSGFMSDTDKSKLDGIPGNTQAQITQNANEIASNLALINNHSARHLPNGADPLATDTPNTISPDGANLEGTANSFARSDHQHNIPAAAPTGSLGANTNNTEGNGSSFARNNHTHNLATGTPSTQNPDQANSEGTSNNLARADHIHNIPVASALNIGDANSEGTSNSFSRSDHEHNVFPVFQDDDEEDTDFQSTTGTGFTNALTLTTANLLTGRYEIKWFYIWSHNSTGNDFRAQVQLDNSDGLLPEHQQEPQDSGGGGAGGTDQRFISSGFARRNLTGVHTIDLDFASSVGGILASIHLARLSIRRVG